MSILLPTSPGIRSAKPRLIDFGGLLTPTLGGPSQRLNRLGSRFAVDFEMPPMWTEPDGRIWVSRLARALTEGAIMRWPQPDLKMGAPGAIVTDGGGQLGTTLNIRAGTPNYVIREGQFFSIVSAGRRYLHAAAAQGLLDGDGKAALPIWPMLRVSPQRRRRLRVRGAVCRGLAVGQRDGLAAADRAGDQSLLHDHRGGVTSFSPAVDAALAARTALVCGAVEIVLPANTIRLIDGSGWVRFADGRLFTGQDPVFGTIAAIDTLSDGTGDTAPAVSLTLYPASDAASATLAAAEMQGSQVSLWLVLVDQATGQIVGDPELLFFGLLDVPKLSSTGNGRKLEYEVTSAFEDFFLNDDGARLNDRFHRSIWPGEKGLEYVTAVTQQIYWGQNATSGVKS